MRAIIATAEVEEDWRHEPCKHRREPGRSPMTIRRPPLARARTHVSNISPPTDSQTRLTPCNEACHPEKKMRRAEQTFPNDITERDTMGTSEAAGSRDHLFVLGFEHFFHALLPVVDDPIRPQSPQHISLLPAHSSSQIGFRAQIT